MCRTVRSAWTVSVKTVAADCCAGAVETSPAPNATKVQYANAIANPLLSLLPVLDVWGRRGTPKDRTDVGITCDLSWEIPETAIACGRAPAARARPGKK